MFTGIRLREKVKPAARLIRGIAHKHKLSIVYLLSFEPLEAKEIIADIDQPQNLVEHHLKDMFVAGWVSKTKVGKRVTYRLNEKAFRDLFKLIKDTPLSKRLLPEKRGY